LDKSVRELRNAVEHASVLARSGTIGLEHLPAPLEAFRSTSVESPLDASITSLVARWAKRKLDGQAVNDLYQQLLELVEPPLIEVALGKERGQCAIAARNLGMHRSTLRKKAAKHRIDVRRNERMG
jgi:two-component system nitrogen regulation response regulator GlnG